MSKITITKTYKKDLVVVIEAESSDTARSMKEAIDALVTFDKVVVK